MIDGKVFDPARHFSAWRKRDGTAMAHLRLEAEDGLRAALAATPQGQERWQIVADLLNEKKVKTIRSGCWTPENVRKLAGRITNE